MQCIFDFIMDRSRTKKALGSEEEEGRITSLSDEDLRARNKVLEPKDERKLLCLVGSKKIEISQYIWSKH